MAVFTQNEELDRQGQRVAMDKVGGWQKKAMSVLGYKDDGTTNKWGKALSAITPTSGLRNLGARAISGNSDTNEVLKEGTATAFGTDMAQLKFSKDVLKTIATGGAAAGAGAGASAIGGAGASGAGSGIVGDAASSGADAVAEGSTSTGGSLGSGFGADKGAGILNKIGGDESVKTPDLLPDAQGAAGDVASSNPQMSQWKTSKETEGFSFQGGKVYDPQGNELGEEEEVFNKESGGGSKIQKGAQNILDKADKVENKVEKLGDKLGAVPIVGSGLQLAASIGGMGDEAKEEADKFQGQTKKSNFSYL